MEALNNSFLPDDYLPHLDALNRIVMESGVPAEGNLFYFHHEPNPRRESVYSYFYLKRKNFAAVARDSNVMLEIGMNAGHEALLALSRGVEYHGVDIAEYPYVQPVADYLKSQFGARFHFYAGDSLSRVPQLCRDQPALRFDCIHIDGHHGVDYYTQDLRNALTMALKNAWVVVDDTDMEGIQFFFDEQVAKGVLIADAPEGWEPCVHHAVARAA